MNILINSYCNLHCPYCFADDTMCEQGTKNMSIENFKIAIDWCKKLGQNEMRIIGGEPTLAPLFPTFLDMVSLDPWFDRFLIFSNLTFGKDIAKKVAQINTIKPVAFLPNINEFSLLNQTQRSNILYNINFLSENLQMFNTIGINIYKPDMDLSLIEQIISDNPNIDTLRYSIAIPNTEILNNNFNFYEYYHQFQNMLIKLSDLGSKLKVNITCDCNNLPICCFDNEVITKLLLENGYTIFGTNAQTLNCTGSIIDLKPDLSIAPCFGLFPKEKIYITDFNNAEELLNWCDLDGDRSEYIAREECLTCERFLKTNKSCSCKSCHLIKKEGIIL